MRTSLNEIKLIDGYLFNSNPPEDALILDALLIVNPALTQKVAWQKKTHEVINQYSRKRLKAEIESVHQQLFKGQRHHTFRQKIFEFFR